MEECLVEKMARHAARVFNKGPQMNYGEWIIFRSQHAIAWSSFCTLFSEVIDG